MMDMGKPREVADWGKNLYLKIVACISVSRVEKTGTMENNYWKE